LFNTLKCEMFHTMSALLHKMPHFTCDDDECKHNVKKCEHC